MVDLVSHENNGEDEGREVQRPESGDTVPPEPACRHLRSPRPREHEAGQYEEEVDADVAEVRDRIDPITEPVLQAVMHDHEEGEPEPQAGQCVQPGRPA